MNKKEIFISAACSIAAFGIGCAVGLIFKKPEKEEILGTLRIDNSDPDVKNALFLELGVPVEYVSSKKVAHLRVLKENYLRK
jgi:hypothetical protein